MLNNVEEINILNVNLTIFFDKTSISKKNGLIINSVDVAFGDQWFKLEARLPFTFIGYRRILTNFSWYTLLYIENWVFPHINILGYYKLMISSANIKDRTAYAYEVTAIEGAGVGRWKSRSAEMSLVFFLAIGYLFSNSAKKNSPLTFGSGISLLCRPELTSVYLPFHQVRMRHRVIL